MSTIAKHHQSGFTLIELLVVISIIGILAGLLLTNFVGIRERAADTRLKNDLQQFKKALRLYYNDNQQYPSQAAAPAPGTSFEDNGTVYMKETPSEYTYYQLDSAGETFLLVAPLNNASDEDIQSSRTRCDTGSVTLDDTDYVVCED